MAEIGPARRRADHGRRVVLLAARRPRAGAPRGRQHPRAQADQVRGRRRQPRHCPHRRGGGPALLRRLHDRDLARHRGLSAGGPRGGAGRSGAASSSGRSCSNGDVVRDARRATTTAPSSPSTVPGHGVEVDEARIREWAPAPMCAPRRRDGAAPASRRAGSRKRFGGLVAVDELSMAVPRGRDPRAHRPQRLGQDHHGQRALGPLPAGRRGDPPLRPRHRPAPAAPDRGVRRGADVSDLEALRPHDGARERARCPPSPRSTAEASGRLPRSATRRAPSLLDFVTLDRMRHALAKELSGGQSMLVQIARALMVQPLHVILMDEPFAGVHPAIRDIIMEAILRMNRDEAVTFLIVSHEMAELRRLCQRVSVMDDGRRIAEGTLEEVANDPVGPRGVPRDADTDGAPRARARRGGVRRGHRHPLRHHPPRRAGLHHRRHRAERRGQVDAAQGDLRLPPPAARPHHARRPRHPRAGALRGQAAGHQLCAAGSQYLSPAHRRGEPAARRVGDPAGPGARGGVGSRAPTRPSPGCARSGAGARRRCRAARPRCSPSPRSS